MSERERASLQAARAEGKIEGLRHFLDVLMIMLKDDAERERVTSAGNELVAIFQRERVIQIERYIASARGDLARGLWVRDIDKEPVRR